MPLACSRGTIGADIPPRYIRRKYVRVSSSKATKVYKVYEEMKLRIRGRDSVYFMIVDFANKTLHFD